jgi:hypothetical protein
MRPFQLRSSICCSIGTIYSGLYFLIGMASLSSKWILSHSTLCKFRWSRHRFACSPQDRFVTGMQRNCGV